MSYSIVRLVINNTQGEACATYYVSGIVRKAIFAKLHSEVDYTVVKRYRDLHWIAVVHSNISFDYKPIVIFLGVLPID